MQGNNTAELHHAGRNTGRRSEGAEGDGMRNEQSLAVEAAGGSTSDSFGTPWRSFPPELYIALADLEFGWDKQILPQVKEWWEDGMSGGEIAKRLERDEDEVAVLIMSLARESSNRIRIKSRPGGWFGSGKRKKKGLVLA